MYVRRIPLKLEADSTSPQNLSRLGDKTLPISLAEPEERRAKPIPIPPQLYRQIRCCLELDRFPSIFRGYKRGGRFSVQSIGFSYQFYLQILLLLTESRKKCWRAMGGGEDGGSCNLLRVLFGMEIFFFINKDLGADGKPDSCSSNFQICDFNTFR